MTLILSLVPHLTMSSLTCVEFSVSGHILLAAAPYAAARPEYCFFAWKRKNSKCKVPDQIRQQLKQADD